MDIFTVTLSVMLIELSDPDNSPLQSFESNFNDSIRDLSISATVIPVS